MNSEIRNRQTFSGFLLISLVLSIIMLILVLMPLEPSDYWSYVLFG